MRVAYHKLYLPVLRPKKSKILDEKNYQTVCAHLLKRRDLEHKINEVRMMFKDSVLTHCIINKPLFVKVNWTFMERVNLYFYNKDTIFMTIDMNIILTV